jgi:hypothetical protein
VRCEDKGDALKYRHGTRRAIQHPASTAIVFSAEVSIL